MTEEDCLECPVDHYNDKTNQTTCIPCPIYATSLSGPQLCSCEAGYKLLNTSHCEVCPENHFSESGARSCTRCPHFEAAAPGSDSCYSCTLGEFWENGRCLKCPAHLYGDGISCLECLGGFEAEQGFCYRVADRRYLAMAIKPLSDKDTVFIIVNSLHSLVLVFVVAWINKSKLKQGLCSFGGDPTGINGH